MPIIKIQPTEHPTICRLFLTERHTIERLARDYRVSTTCIERILARYECRRSQRTHSIDLSYFERVDTTNKAYFLGLLFADGCNKSRSVFLGLTDGDEYLIAALKRDVGYEGKTYIMKRKKPHHKDRHCVELCSVKMARDITALGCPPNKSLILQFPTSVPDDLMPHFLRGYLDGDGCVHETLSNGSRRLHCQITSSPDFCTGFRAFITDRLRVTSQQTTYHHSAANDVKMSTRSAIVFLDYVYRNSPIRMHRKFDRFISFLSAYTPKGARGSAIPDQQLLDIKAFWQAKLKEAV